jgi:hypothetical protein
MDIFQTALEDCVAKETASLPLPKRLPGRSLVYCHSTQKAAGRLSQSEQEQQLRSREGVDQDESDRQGSASEA